MDERIMILCSDGAHHKYLINELINKFNVTGVVIEPYNKQIKHKLHKKQYVNYFYMNYHTFRRKIMGYTHYRNKYFSFTPKNENNSPKVMTIEVNNINDDVVKNFVKEKKPNIVIIMGTSIIKQETLSVLGDIIINIHGGYLPDYKGNHCFFFALYNRDYGKIASTIHFVNSGIDTGDIIERIHPVLTPRDNAETLYCKAEKEAITRLIKIIEDFKNDKPFHREKQSYNGKLYLARDRKPYHELFMLIKKIKIIKEIKNYE